MIVFVVMHGEQCEGGSVVSVHKNKKDAIKAALAVDCCFPGDWVKDHEFDFWVNGCDFVKVEKHKVK